MSQSAIYAAFDLYPSAKGAATHIYYFSSAMFDYFNGGLLVTLGNEKLPGFQKEGPVEIRRFTRPIKNYLERAQIYGQWLAQLLEQKNHLQVAHFRDIWSGLTLLHDKRQYNTVFEVNALPSVELPYRYKALTINTLDKIGNIERYCLNEADVIVVPSGVIANYLSNTGVNTDKIHIVSNGAETIPAAERPAEAPEKYAVYFGALQNWQGVDVLLKAMKSLRDLQDVYLVVCSSNRPRFSKPYKKLAAKLGVEDKVRWYNQLPKDELFAWVQHAQMSVAPLTDTQRNVEQGCSPLKIFESMACKTTIVASDLPVVREILTPNENAKLVRAGRPAELSRAMRFLFDYPSENKRLAENAFRLFQNRYLWEHKQKELQVIYNQLLH